MSLGQPTLGLYQPWTLRAVAPPLLSGTAICKRSTTTRYHHCRLSCAVGWSCCIRPCYRRTSANHHLSQTTCRRRAIQRLCVCRSAPPTRALHGCRACRQTSSMLPTSWSVAPSSGRLQLAARAVGRLGTLWRCSRPWPCVDQLRRNWAGWKSSAERRPSLKGGAMAAAGSTRRQFTSFRTGQPARVCRSRLNGSVSPPGGRDRRVGVRRLAHRGLP